MIRENHKKISFIPYVVKKGKKKADIEDVPTINISPKYGSMVFGAKAVRLMGIEGKWIKFFYEPTRKIIGWKAETTITQAQMKEWKLCKVHKNGIWMVGAKGLLDAIRIGSKDGAYKHLEVKKYRETGLLVSDNPTYFYVEVKRKAIKNNHKEDEQK